MKPRYVRTFCICGFFLSHTPQKIANCSVFDVAFLLLQSDFNGLPMGTYQAFPSIHPPQIPATPPSYESVDDNADKNVSSAQIIGPGPKPEASAKPPSRPVDTYDNFVLPELPSVPDTLPTASAGASTSASEDIDFDDLSRRFEELKKKT
uniref:IST1 factor associated with ESCRT-III n=1 Tax=Rousettus aegyptiacus TaxID=9407 RepID=A0A7J8CH89_ROUAE|nr:IST1 factor associated with ESCRT-III [Rousettus aegyptiacus]